MNMCLHGKTRRNIFDCSMLITFVDGYLSRFKRCNKRRQLVPYVSDHARLIISGDTDDPLPVPILVRINHTELNSFGIRQLPSNFFTII